MKSSERIRWENVETYVRTYAIKIDKSLLMVYFLGSSTLANVGPLLRHFCPFGFMLHYSFFFLLLSSLDVCKA